MPPTRAGAALATGCVGALMVAAALTLAADRPTATAPRAAWQELGAATIARTEVGAARVGGFAYVVGGYVPPSGATTAIVERYDLRRDRWRRVRPLPLALNHAAAASDDRHLYVVGGYTSGLGGETATLLRYEPGRDRWTRLPDMPTARGALGAAITGGRLYAVGGARRGGEALRTVEVFDLRTRRWRTGPPMPTAREHLAVTAAGGAVYAISGRTAPAGNLAAVERLVRGRWQRLPGVRHTRGGIAATPAGSEIILLGGEESAGTIRSVEAYAPARRRWRFLAAMPTPRHGLGAVTFRGRVFTFSGGTEPGLTYSARTEALRVGR
jgi:hypothetical protein